MDILVNFRMRNFKMLIFAAKDKLKNRLTKSEAIGDKQKRAENVEGLQLPRFLS